MKVRFTFFHTERSINAFLKDRLYAFYSYFLSALRLPMHAVEIINYGLFIKPVLCNRLLPHVPKLLK